MKKFWKKMPPVAKLGIIVAAGVAAVSGIVAAATGAAFGTVALLTAGALVGAVGGAMIGLGCGIFPSLLYAKAVNRRNGDGWQSTPAFLYGLAVSAVIGAGIGGWRGYVQAGSFLDDFPPAKTEFNLNAAPPSAFKAAAPTPAPKNAYVLKFS